MDQPKPETKKTLTAALEKLRKKLEAEKDRMEKQLVVADELVALAARAVEMLPEPVAKPKKAKAADNGAPVTAGA